LGCLSENPSAIQLLRENQDKINWHGLSSNPNAIQLLRENQDKFHCKCNKSVKKSIKKIVKKLQNVNIPETKSIIKRYKCTFRTTNMTDRISNIKDQIEKMSINYHAEIARILIKEHNIAYDENKNGLFINLSNVNESVLDSLCKFITYVELQEQQLNLDESKKDGLKDIYFNTKE